MSLLLLSNRPAIFDVAPATERVVRDFAAVFYGYLVAVEDVLAINFAADTWAPARAGKDLLNKLQTPSAVQWCWSAADSNGVALDHFSWLKQPELVAPKVAQFMQAP